MSSSPSLDLFFQEKISLLVRKMSEEILLLKSTFKLRIKRYSLHKAEILSLGISITYVIIFSEFYLHSRNVTQKEPSSKTKKSSNLNELPYLPNTGLWFNCK